MTLYFLTAKSKVENNGVMSSELQRKILMTWNSISRLMRVQIRQQSKTSYSASTLWQSVQTYLASPKYLNKPKTRKTVNSGNGK